MTFSYKILLRFNPAWFLKSEENYLIKNSGVGVALYFYTLCAFGCEDEIIQFFIPDETRMTCTQYLS